MLGATEAGLAFSNSSVALVHGMSRPIGAHFHVPHGLSNAMLLPAITRFSVPGAETRYAEAARRIGFAEQTDSDAAAAAKLITGLERLNKDLSVPTPADYGINEATWNAKMALMAEQAWPPEPREQSARPNSRGDRRSVPRGLDRSDRQPLTAANALLRHGPGAPS